MKTHRHLLIAALTSIFMMGALPAQSAMMAASYQAAPISKPLVIIRFNQKRVLFQRSLYTALAKAVEVAPAVQFNVVSYVPRSGRADVDQRLLGQANGHLRMVLDEMQKMGVPQSQISVNSEMDPSLRYDEVHIFVR